VLCTCSLCLDSVVQCVIKPRSNFVHKHLNGPYISADFSYTVV
jgi:hypothetical protein